MSHISCVLFDLDGTLIDTNQLIIDSFQHTLKVHLGRAVSETEIARTFGRPLVDILREYAADKVDAMLKTYREYNESRHDTTTRLFPGVKETLTALKSAGCKLGVVTGKRRHLALRGLKLFDLDVYMAVVVTPEDTNRHKPYPAPVLKALELLHRQPENTLMVGDSPLDIASARAVGTYTAAVGWSVVPPRLVLAEQPDFVLRHMTDLIDLCLFSEEAAQEG